MSAFAASDAMRPIVFPAASIVYVFVAIVLLYEFDACRISNAGTHATESDDSRVAAGSLCVSRGDGVVQFLCRGCGIESGHHITSGCNRILLARGDQAFYKRSNFLRFRHRRYDTLLKDDRSRERAKKRGALSLVSAQCSVFNVMSHTSFY
jgi:hypothetical protein